MAMETSNSTERLLRDALGPTLGPALGEALGTALGEALSLGDELGLHSVQPRPQSSETDSGRSRESCLASQR
jgi:hypothetical protein